MTEHERGGKAFPRPASVDTSSGTLPDGDVVDPAQTGMDLRDFFAAHALAGILASPCTGDARWSRDDGDYAADYAYTYADAMLKRRDRA